MYSSVEDVRLALTRDGLDTDPETAASFEDSQIEDAIAESDGMIDTYIGSQYSVPMDDPNPVAKYPVRAWSRDLGAWYATLTFRKSQDIEVDDPVRLRYQRVMDILEAIAAGELHPPLPPSDPPPELVAQGVFVENLYEGKLFGPEDFRLQYATLIAPHRYGDLAGGALGAAILILAAGDPVPPDTPEGTLIVFVGP